MMFSHEVTALWIFCRPSLPDS